MRRNTFAFSFASALMIWCSSAQAVTRYVASYGSGTVCSETAPCATMTDGLRSANPGDTIQCLNSPGAGAISISKSITIDCSGVRATLNDASYTTSRGDTTVRINIPVSTNDPLRTVRLRGLTIEGVIPSLSKGYLVDHGIVIEAASTVYIDDCVIVNMEKSGIFDARTGGQTRLYVSNTSISNGGGPGIVAASQGPAVTVLDSVSLLNNTYGLAAAGGNNVVITRSTISGNTTAGLHADNGAQINLLNSVMSHNNANINAYGTIRLKESDIQFSNVAIQGSGARSAGANRFLGNVTLGSVPPLVSGAPADVYD